MRSLVWFRRDLRVADNSALHHACQDSTNGVVGLYVITPDQWSEHDDADCKVCFWLENLRSLSAELAKLRIPLLVQKAPTFAGSVGKVLSIAKKQDCNSVFLNREYEVNEWARDSDLESQCRASDIAVRQFHDRVLVPPREITTKDGRFYSVFTPYRRVWDTKVLQFAEVLPKPKKQKELDIAASRIPTSIDGFDFASARSDLWPAGEQEAQQRLDNFSGKIKKYNEGRDIPSLSGTSLLSPYLAAGVVSPRQCLQAALTSSGRLPNTEGAKTWISELTWRDFYAHVMVGFPRVSMHQPFKLKTNALNWRENKNDFQAWCDGQTGYPIVDAGMRQLNRTGWMHNRLRMVTAMFLTKNLLIDWRLGERYFMKKLVDGDLAANNGGWQWSASTGTDSVPYFRIFNPFSQSKRFDPDGKFIKLMCPELAEIPSSALHDPKNLTVAIENQNASYPEFIVDYKKGRERALAAFKSL